MRVCVSIAPGSAAAAAKDANHTNSDMLIVMVTPVSASEMVLFFFHLIARHQAVKSKAVLAARTFILKMK